ncbi:ATP-binding protein [Deinococcus aquatilis]|uniref:ATP-binding protein n=1 Tax=Deinococcus aquatilis TaxID=519440 RepID=UPI0003766B3C|nr:ATP-binding protein [Deinococcus aquatilis]
MSPRFIGRQRELGALQAFYASEGTPLATVRGRRRVGKSTLLLHSLEPGQSAYHQAAQLTPENNYARFHDDMTGALTPLVQPGSASDIRHAQNWRSLILALGQAATELGRLTVVIDEFPHLSRGDSTLESVLQEALGRIERLDQPLKLVLCGSSLRPMEALLERSAPLHGRSALNLVLRPFDYLESAQFTPAWTPEQLVQARTVFGGMPQYLGQLQDQLSVGENYERLVLDPDGPLHEEAHWLLSDELNEPRIYASILRAMARGHSKAGEIISAAGIHASSLQKYLGRLEELGLVRHIRSAHATPKTRHQRYSLADPFIASWFRYALPHLSALKIRGGKGAWDQLVAPGINTDKNAAPGTFEDICRHWTALHLDDFWEGEHGEVGQLLQGKGEHDAEIDVACRLGRGQQVSWLLGECQWTAPPQGGRALQQLQENAKKLLGEASVRQWLVFSRAGFQKEFRAVPMEHTRLIDLAELYRTSW